jgi:hypothetical protein
MTLHFSQIFLTLGLTFTVNASDGWLFMSIGNSASGEVVWR